MTPVEEHIAYLPLRHLVELTDWDALVEIVNAALRRSFTPWDAIAVLSVSNCDGREGARFEAATERWALDSFEPRELCLAMYSVTVRDTAGKITTIVVDCMS